MINPEEYYGLVKWRAKKIYRRLPNVLRARVALEDLEQEGYIGLLQAASTYDPRRGTKFATHAIPRIDGEIKSFLGRQDPLTQRERQVVRELESKKEALAQTLGREPAVSELAQALGISEEEVRRREELRVAILSLEDLTQSDTETKEQSIRALPSPWSGQEGMLARDIDDCLERVLDDQERLIFTLILLEGLTLDAVTRIVEPFWKISRATVQRREQTARQKVKQCLEDKGWEVGDI